MSEEPIIPDPEVNKYIMDKTILCAKMMEQYFNDDPPNKDIGFILLVFPFGEAEGRCNYVSNGIKREDARKLLGEQAKRLK